MFNDDALQRQIDQLCDEIEDAVQQGQDGMADDLSLQLEELYQNNS
tara:strand:- start:5316 stop:5453 length:138 start_codon:yes stop_codon:yes gene_type:complete